MYIYLDTYSNRGKEMQGEPVQGCRRIEFSEADDLLSNRSDM